MRIFAEIISTYLYTRIFDEIMSTYLCTRICVETMSTIKQNFKILHKSGMLTLKV